MLKIIIATIIGGALGGLVGYWGTCSGGTCPLTCNPVGGIIVGALMGLLLASTFTGPPRKVARSPNYIEVASEEQFKQMLATNAVVLVDFYADWCGPCHILKPAIQTLADEYAGRAAVAGVDVDRQKALSGQYGVRAVPDVRIFVKGVEKAALTGVRPAEDYRAELDKVERFSCGNASPHLNPLPQGERKRIQEQCASTE